MVINFTINGHKYTNDPAVVISAAVPPEYQFIGYNAVKALSSLAGDMVVITGKTTDTATAAAQAAQAFASASEASKNSAMNGAQSATSSAAAAGSSAGDAASSAQAAQISRAAAIVAKEAAEAAANAAIASSTMIDTNPVVKGALDPTKRLRFAVDGLTAGATRVLKIQDKDGTVAMVADIQESIARFNQTGDVLTTARTLPAPDWLKCDGSDYLASSYPDLAGLVGPARSFAKLSDPATLPAGTGGGVAYSADGVYLAVGHGATPFISVYKLTAGVYVKLAALPAAPGMPKGLAISPDGIYLIASTTQSPYLTMWKRTGDTFAPYALSAQLTQAAAATTTPVAFSPNGQFLAVGQTSAGTNLYIYTYPGGVFGLVATMSSSASVLVNGAQALAFSPDGTHLTASGVSAPFMAAWSISGTTFTNTPTFAGQITYSGINATYSSDSKYLAVGLFSVNGPGFAVFKRSGNVYTKLSNPAGAPEGYGSGTSFSPDTGQLAVTTSVAPYLIVFRRSGDQFIARSDMPSTTVVQALSQTPTVAFSPVGSDLACTSTNTPFLQVFRETVDPTRVRVPNLPAADTLVASYIKT